MGGGAGPLLTCSSLHAGEGASVMSRDRVTGPRMSKGCARLGTQREECVQAASLSAVTQDHPPEPGGKSPGLVATLLGAGRTCVQLWGVRLPLCKSPSAHTSRTLCIPLPSGMNPQLWESSSFPWWELLSCGQQVQQGGAAGSKMVPHMHCVWRVSFSCLQEGRQYMSTAPESIPEATIYRRNSQIK